MIETGIKKIDMNKKIKVKNKEWLKIKIVSCVNVKCAKRHIVNVCVVFVL